MVGWDVIHYLDSNKAKNWWKEVALSISTVMPILSIASTYWLLDKEIGTQIPAFYWEAMSLSHKDCTRKIITMTDLWYSGP